MADPSPGGATPAGGVRTSSPALAAAVARADDRALDEASPLGLRIGIHDASRVEWVVAVPLVPGKPLRYAIEFEVEIPAHLYAGHDVWEQHQELARLQSPELDDLAVASGGQVRIDDVRRATLAVAHQLKVLQDRAKRLAMVANSLARKEPREDVASEMKRLIRLGQQEIARGRDQIAVETATDGAEVRLERQLADEFLSTKLVDFLSSVEKVVDEILTGDRARFAAEYEPAAVEIREQVANALEQEMGHRRARHYLTPRGDRIDELERFLDRASHLKKHFQEVLFLELETDLVDNRLRNWVAVLMAAIASVIYFFGMLAVFPQNGATTAGISLGTAAALGAVLYAFKDRVKEMGRAWLGERLIRRFGNRLVTLRVPERLVGGRPVVVESRDTFDVRSEQRDDDLNPDAGRTRRAVVMHYTKLASSRDAGELSARGFHSLKHVFRHDLSPLFSRLDDPLKRVPVLDHAQRRVRFVEAPRSYRFPVRARLSCRLGTVERAAVVVVHKQGIDRIEDAATIDDSESLAYRRTTGRKPALPPSRTAA